MNELTPDADDLQLALASVDDRLREPWGEPWGEYAKREDALEAAYVARKALDRVAALEAENERLRNGDFYEEDEDPAHIHAIFEAGEKGVTAPPSFGQAVEPTVNVGNVSQTPEWRANLGNLPSAATTESKLSIAVAALERLDDVDWPTVRRMIDGQSLPLDMQPMRERLLRALDRFTDAVREALERIQS